MVYKIKTFLVANYSYYYYYASSSDPAIYQYIRSITKSESILLILHVHLDPTTAHIVTTLGKICLICS